MRIPRAQGAGFGIRACGRWAVSGRGINGRNEQWVTSDKHGNGADYDSCRKRQGTQMLIGVVM